VTSYAEIEALKTKLESLNVKDLKRLISLSKKLDHRIEQINLDPSQFTPVINNEFRKITEHFKQQLAPKLGSLFEMASDKSLDFKKLKLDHTFAVPGSNGVGYEATDYIPEWNLLAIGTYHDRKGDLVLWDLKKKEMKSVHKDIHDVGITYVRWVPEAKVIVTCAYDKLIKVFRPIDKGREIAHIATLRGHSQRIRCMTYISQHNVLVTGGDEPDLKVWNMRTLKLNFYLCTGSEGLLGSYLMYMPSNKLLGVGFKSGKIRFYNLMTKQQVFEFSTDSQGRYPCGLQLIPKRNQIICNVREYVVKLWNFDELNLKIRDDATIKTEGKEPNCALFNQNQDQIVIACLTPKLEIYDFNEHKLRPLDLSGQIKEANSLRYLKEINKISICDRVSGNVCILGE
jgi:WD40 repeat protein